MMTTTPWAWPWYADVFWMAVGCGWTGITFVVTPHMLRRHK